VIGAVIALCLNVFVLIVQAFLKVPPLKAMAPTQSEPPFLIAQLEVMTLFVVLAIFATKRFHNPPIPRLDRFRKRSFQVPTHAGVAPAVTRKIGLRTGPARTASKISD
jgi:hypothetical protein